MCTFDNLSQKNSINPKNNKMNKTITARHNANKQVLIVLSNFNSKYAGIPVFVHAVSVFDGLINNTEDLFTKVGSVPNKTAGNKNIARAELVGVSIKVSNIVKVYAFMTKNENLSNSIISSESELAMRMRQQDLLDYSKNLANNIAPIATELLNYGLSEALIEELTKEIAEFKEVISEPRQLINERKTSNELIEDNIDKVYSLLINQLDPLMELFVDDNEFYIAYKSARMIVDPASRKKVEEEIS